MAVSGAGPGEIPASWVVVGRIGRPHGIRGQVTVEVRTDDPDRRFRDGAMLHRRDAAALRACGHQWHNGTLLLSLDGVTDRDGRCRLTEAATGVGTHRLVFATGRWFAEQDRETFYPEVVLSFAVREPADAHHVPLLLAPFGYSTYRGS